MYTKFDTGDILFYYTEEITIIVVMSNADGIRYINPMEPVDEDGKVITTYLSKSAISNSCYYLGNMNDISIDLIKQLKSK